MKCIICREPIDVQKTWTEGHNALPVFEGRCCTNCNENMVKPARETIRGLELASHISSEDFVAELVASELSPDEHD